MPKDENRFRAVGYKLTQEEFNALERACSALGLSKSAYARGVMRRELGKRVEMLVLVEGISSSLQNIADTLTQLVNK